MTHGIKIDINAIKSVLTRWITEDTSHHRQRSIAFGATHST